MNLIYFMFTNWL